MHAIGDQPTVVAKFILDGTVVGEGPLDLFSQYWFLDCASSPPLLLQLQEPLREWEKGYDHAPAASTKLKEYRNLPELTERIMKHSFRVLRKDCLDIPDKSTSPNTTLS